MEYIIPAASAIVVAVIEALAARDRSRRSPITNSSSGLPHELVGHYFVEVNN